MELTFFLGPMLIMESSKKEFLQQETSIYTQPEAAIQMTSASSVYDLKKKKKVVWISRSWHAFQTRKKARQDFQELTCIPDKKKGEKKKVKKGFVERDLLSRTNLDNGIEQKGVSTMEYQVLYPRAAPIFDHYLFSEKPKLD